MSELVEFARRELALLRRGADEPDEMQDAIEAQVMAMIAVFSVDGHSGSSAAYTIGLLEKLLRYEPLAPLTGEDDEWNEITTDRQQAYMTHQNKRCSHVFKRRDGTAYDANAVIWRDPDGSTWQNGDSRRDITFPYTPKTEIVERPAPPAD